MKQYLGDHNYRTASFAFKDEESYYDYKVGNVVFPSDYTYEKMHGEVIVWNLKDKYNEVNK
jgi:hypothetical protein